MRVGYLIGTNAGAYDQPLPTPKNAAATLDAMIKGGNVVSSERVARQAAESFSAPTSLAEVEL
ncbi:MAG: hypothetical protein P8R42_07390 [Candidatus Binatia bacterium]|nr:hypothetical protein [Candidatus Binatia bacterium]